MQWQMNLTKPALPRCAQPRLAMCTRWLSMVCGGMSRLQQIEFFERFSFTCLVKLNGLSD